MRFARLVPFAVSVCCLAGAGCAAYSGKNVEVLVVDGCAINIEGVSISQARKLLEDWDIGPDCKLSVSSHKDGSSVLQPQIAPDSE